MFGGPRGQRPGQGQGQMQRQRPTQEQMDSIRKVMEANEAEIKAVLTPDQQKKYDEDRSQMRRGGGMRGPRPNQNN